MRPRRSCTSSGVICEPGWKVSMIGTILLLCVWLFAVFVAVCFALPSTIPGHGSCPAAAIGVCCLLAGPWVCGRRCTWEPLFFIYGCLGGLLFIPLFCFHRRVLPAQMTSPDPAQRVGDRMFVFACIVGAVFCGLVCRFVAAASLAREESRHRASGCCRECGYLLYGLPEPRCPEYGTPFDSARLRMPADEQEQVGRIEDADQDRGVR